MTAHRDNPMPPPRQTWRGRCAFVVALLCAAWLAPGAAHASCGSHVRFGDHPLADHPEKPRPCSGPTCSDRPLIPLPPVAPSAPAPASEASGSAVLTLAAEATSAPLAEPLPPLHSLQHPRTIFRPPRHTGRSG